MRLLLTSALLLAGCFDDLSDRRCKVAAEDCFHGEICPSGRCVTFVQNVDAAPQDERVTVRVEAFRAGEAEPVAEAQINGSVGTPCNCQPGLSGETDCRFLVDPETPQTFCAVTRGYRPCAVVVAPADLRDGARIAIELSPCERPDCTEPLSCDCATVPACDTEEDP